jgi:hypothetical protein
LITTLTTGPITAGRSLENLCSLIDRSSQCLSCAVVHKIRWRRDALAEESASQCLQQNNTEPKQPNMANSSMPRVRPAGRMNSAIYSGPIQRLLEQRMAGGGEVDNALASQKESRQPHRPHGGSEVLGGRQWSCSGMLSARNSNANYSTALAVSVICSGQVHRSLDFFTIIG